jgi:hypothetical protein
MATKDLSGEEICRIIATCKKSKVSHFRLGQLEFSFGPKCTLGHQPKSTAQKAETHNDSSVVQVSEPVEAIMTTSNEEALEEAAMSQLLIDDPLAHETLMIDAATHEGRPREDIRHQRT